MRKNSFLYRVAADIGKRYSQQMKDLTVVFPSRRSGRVFQHHLIQQATVPMWSPNIITIDELFKSHSQFTEADPLTLVSMLHESWNEVTKLDEPFEKFYFFGKMMLSDFDLIDKYRIAPASIFRHIRDIKEIEEQFKLTEEDSEALRQLKKYFQEERTVSSPAGDAFLKVWTSLLPVYQSLKSRLAEENLAWSGLIYRELASRPEPLSENAKGKYLFCGFNRINRCEQLVFNHLRDRGLAEFYWNDDPMLRTDYRQEAGKFLIENLKSYPPVSTISTNMMADKKEVNILPVNFQSLQVQVVTQLMKEAEAENGKTGLILNDEDLLLPLLSSLPENEIKINVSAGLKLVKTPVYDLIRSVIQMHENAVRNKGEFHYRDIEQLFFNPLLPDFYQKWLDKVKIVDPEGKPSDRRSQVFFSRVDLQQMNIHELVPLFFQAVKNPVDVVQLLLDALKGVFEMNTDASNPEEEEEMTGLYQELIAEAHKVLMRVRETLPAWSKAIQFPLLRNIIRDMAQSRRIPFKGEPLQGIQVTGALEARNLGFDHLILPSMNEGIQPGSPRQSLIPYSIKKYFGLPTTEDEMADQSYYFRNLIAEAKKIDIIYDESSSGLRKNEPSRFVQQLIYGDLPNWKVSTGKKLEMPIDNNMPKPIEVERTAEIHKNLLEQLEKRGLSPSRFLDFLSCELRFYFSYILGADEKEMVPEEVDARVQGTILHRVLENLYSDYKQAEITAEHIDRLLKKHASEVEKVLREERKLGNKPMAGHDLVARRYIEKMVGQVLNYDRQRTPFVMEDHEKEINFTREFKGHTIKFTGLVDRIHRSEQGYHIVDYKTGRDETTSSRDNCSPLPGNEQQKAGSLNKAFIQILTYCWLLGEQDPKFKSTELIPELYSTRSLNSSYNPVLKLKEPRAREEYLTTSNEFYELFTQQIRESLHQLLDENRPFLQAKDEGACKFCTFKNICMRGGGEW